MWEAASYRKISASFPEPVPLISECLDLTVFRHFILPGWMKAKFYLLLFCCCVGYWLVLLLRGNLRPLDCWVCTLRLQKNLLELIAYLGELGEKRWRWFKRVAEGEAGQEPSEGGCCRVQGAAESHHRVRSRLTIGWGTDGARGPCQNGSDCTPVCGKLMALTFGGYGTSWLLLVPNLWPSLPPESVLRVHRLSSYPNAISTAPSSQFSVTTNHLVFFCTGLSLTGSVC